jgi:hypothetical protein
MIKKERRDTGLDFLEYGSELSGLDDSDDSDDSDAKDVKDGKGKDPEPILNPQLMQEDQLP